MNDTVCCEVIEVIPDTDKMVCGMKGVTRKPEDPPPKPPLGLLSTDDFPLIYKYVSIPIDHIIITVFQHFTDLWITFYVTNVALSYFFKLWTSGDSRKKTWRKDYTNSVLIQREWTININEEYEITSRELRSSNNVFIAMDKFCVYRNIYFCDESGLFTVLFFNVIMQLLGRCKKPLCG